MTKSHDMSADAFAREGLMMTRESKLLFGGLVMLVLIGPLVAYPIFLIKIMCYALFACAFNLLLGYGGLLSFGHAAFFGAGSYVAGYTAKALGWNPEFVLVGSVIIGGALGSVFAAVAIRRKGIYQAMITLALAQMVYLFALRAPFTNGENGIQHIPRGNLFGIIDLENPMALYYFVGTVFVAGVFFIYRVINSPFGAVLEAIKENEQRAESIGYAVSKYKFVVFVISAAISSLAGGLKAISLQLATLADVHWTTSGDVLFMALIGGIGTLFGPILGAAIMLTLHDVLAGLGSWVVITQSLFFIGCVLLFRRGIAGSMQHWYLVRRPHRSWRR